MRAWEGRMGGVCYDDDDAIHRFESDGEGRDVRVLVQVGV